jgi:hypothetical protein
MAGLGEAAARVDGLKVSRVAVPAAIVLFALAACKSSDDPERDIGWVLQAVEGNTVTLRADHGPCDEFVRTAVTETPTQVTLGVVYRVDTGGCETSLHMTSHTVELEQPLGTRCLKFASDRPAQLPTFAPVVDDQPLRIPVCR